jgi:hypothetical protein
MRNVWFGQLSIGKQSYIRKLSKVLAYSDSFPVSFRYHADIQIDNDARMNWLGFLIYVATLRPVLSMPPPHGGGFVACQVVILGGLTLVPFFLKIHSREVLLRWRDQVFMVQ